VAHTYNPSDSGGRDQEDHSSKQAHTNSSRALSQKNSSQKRAGRVAKGVGPEFKPQYHQKKKFIFVA
jgi:ribosomal protein L44E